MVRNSDGINRTGFVFLVFVQVSCQIKQDICIKQDKLYKFYSSFLVTDVVDDGQLDMHGKK